MAATQHTKKLSTRTALRIMKTIFLRNGYVRIKDESKLKAKGAKNYKKGYEIRFLPKDEAELQLLQNAISTLDYYVCKTFIKHGLVIQPLYGKDITLEFKELQTKAEK